MARKICTTQAGDSVCCTAAQRGLLGRPFTFTTRTGAKRCGQCDVRASASRNPAKTGRPVFQFRFVKSAVCGIGPSGCAALAQLAAPAGMQGTMQLPPPGASAAGGFLGGPFF